MSKKVLSVFLLITMVLLSGCSMPKVYATLPKDVLELNLKAYYTFDYGDDGGIPYLDDVKKIRTADCGDFARQLVYDLKRNGYDCGVVGLQSWYKGANHAMVEVSIRGKTYLLDPTNGLYYQNSLEELRNNPALSRQRIVQHDEEIMEAYASEEFFDGIYFVQKIDGNPDYLKSLSEQIVCIEVEGDIVDGNDGKNIIDGNSSTFLQTNFSEEEQVMEIILKEKMPIGYLGILAYSADEVKDIWGGGGTPIYRC